MTFYGHGRLLHLPPRQVIGLKTSLLIALLLLSGCSWFHRKPPVPDPTELIVTGAPAGSLLFIDGAQVGQPAQAGQHTQVLRVAAGSHLLEIKVGESITYREQTYVATGDRRVITVLSGAAQ
jgi:hypothetical protein